MNEEFILVEEKVQASKFTRYSPTMSLRWLLSKTDVSGVVSILQQKWISDDGTKSLWRDIPTEDKDILSDKLV